MSKPSLREQINNLQVTTKPGRPCGVGLILKELETNDSQSLAEILDHSRTSASAIVILLENNGFKIGSGTIGYHRRRLRGAGCTCPKSVA